MKTCIPLLYLMATIVSAARVERITIDLERPKQPFTLQLTSSTDTEVQAALFASGSEFNPDGWMGILWYGDVSGGIAITNTTSMWGIMSWDVTADLLPTNGRYSVQVLGARGGRLEEWATGILQVRGGLGSTMPPDWTTAGPAYDIATNALAKAELAESWGDHGQAGYATQGWVIERIDEVVETDPVATPLINTHTANTDIHLTPEQSGRIAGAVLGSQIPDYLRSLPAVTNWSFSASGANKSMSFNSQTGVLFNDEAENVSYFLSCFGLAMLSDNGGGSVSFKLDGLRVNDTLYGYPSGIASDIATKADIATAVAGLDPEEHDLKALRLYHYGSTDIVESPAEWFTFAGGVITGFDYQAGREHVVIPWEINGQAVVGIGDRSFFHEYTGLPITVVKAPQTVVGVDNFAFEQCTALTSVNIPQATTIGALVFQQCTALTSVNIPQATTIGEAAFYGCTALTSINLPQATSIAPLVFEGCFSLTKLIIGSDSKPTFVEGWNNNTNPDLKIYVTNPYATGWDGITEVDGTPVVRIVNTEMLEDLIPDVDAAIGTATNAVVTALTSPYQPWTATITPVSGTATITRAHGLYPKLVLTGKTTISIDSATYPTEGTSAVKLSLFAGANEVELDETNVMYAEPIEISDTEWTTVYFERTGNSAWRAVTW